MFIYRIIAREILKTIHLRYSVEVDKSEINHFLSAQSN